MRETDAAALNSTATDPARRARGIAAALEVFQRAGVTPQEAAAGAGKRQHWDVRGFDPELEPTAEEHEAAAAWDDAEAAAFAAAFGDDEAPPDACLFLRDAA